MTTALRVLILEDQAADAELMLQALHRAGYAPESVRVDTEAAFLAHLDPQPEFILADYTLPQFGAPAALRLLQERGLDIPCIIVTGSVSEEMAVACMKAGAADYLLKDRLARLGPAVAHALEAKRLREEKRRAEEALRHRAFFDDITDLPNRLALEDAIAARIAQPMRLQSCAVMALDLDRFHEVNATFGWSFGDAVLRQVSERLQKVCGADTIVARVAGDEFGVLLPDLGPTAEPNALVQGILRAFEEPFVLQGEPISIDASAGIALYPGHGDSANILMRRAARAVQRAKETGSGYIIYSPERDEHNINHVQLLGDLREAIERETLTLWYQPIVALATQRVCGFEALLRWNHAQHGMVPPGEFIPLAERTGLSRRLTPYVVAKAAQQLYHWRRQGLELPISVNISPRAFQDPGLATQIGLILETWGVPAKLLQVEITETAVLADPLRAEEICKQLMDRGIGVALDDFGVGHSPLSHLKRLQVKSLKIDRWFVSDMVMSPASAAIVQAVITLGDALGRSVVAEGVEDRATYDLLRTLGCNQAQGYFMSRPLPPEQLAEWLGAGGWNPPPA